MQSDKPELDVTVVIPTFNRTTLITRALESLRNQHHLPARIIVVDDASSDGTPAVVGRWADETGLPVIPHRLRHTGDSTFKALSRFQWKLTSQHT